MKLLLLINGSDEESVRLTMDIFWGEFDHGAFMTSIHEHLVTSSEVISGSFQVHFRFDQRVNESRSL